MSAATRVAIGVCTAYRPVLLRDCLMALAAQNIPPTCEITAFIVDNEPAPAGRPIVDACAAACPFPLVYRHEPKRGIPQARNAVLDACGGRFDWIAFTDDDCRPAPDWIASLLDAAVRHGSDVVYGRREWLVADPAPFWLSLPERAAHVEGEVLQTAATHNVLMAGWLGGLTRKERPLLRFDERLAHGEDTDFFFRAALQGARIVYSAAPVVYERISGHRATLRYQAMRSFHYGASRSYFHRRHRGLDAAATRLLARLVWQLPVAAARLIAAPLVAPFSRRLFKGLVVKAVRRLVGAAGALAGLAGYIGNPYRVIADGVPAGRVTPSPGVRSTTASGPDRRVCAR